MNSRVATVAIGAGSAAFWVLLRRHEATVPDYYYLIFLTFLLAIVLTVTAGEVVIRRQEKRGSSDAEAAFDRGDYLRNVAAIHPVEAFSAASAVEDALSATEPEHQDLVSKQSAS